MRGLCWGLTFTLGPEGEREAATRGARGRAEHRSVVSRGNAAPNGSKTAKGLSKKPGSPRPEADHCGGDRAQAAKGLGVTSRSRQNKQNGGHRRKGEEVSGWGNGQ